ncbi:response regulator transcription factor [Actinomyces bowdenii]|uniref:response regulator transcription factor n=1 Tax=Actinomyces bowdenii TaxID=131109 RepID=UPI00214B0C44|nr:response regulator transcription factor [Actinomyces bowdenii]MCR2053257.1 response regulator transcription factor [Actinomyces bowdenii]MDO5064746.1 response regulator transcription factor [Actinomyces bowdenii]
MRIVLADDAALLREGLAGLLGAAGHEVVAQARSAPELCRAVHDLAAVGALPDVVVTDVRMPPGMADDGLQAALELRRAHPGLPVVVLSAYVAGPYVRTLLEDDAGAVGYLLKERVGRVADFMSSLDLVVAGGVVVDPEVIARILASGGREPDAPTLGPGSPAGPTHPGLARLTDREREVLALMAEGLANSQIAQQLILSEGAVAKHIANVFLKLDLPPGEDNRRVRAVLTWLRAAA